MRLQSLVIPVEYTVNHYPGWKQRPTKLTRVGWVYARKVYEIPAKRQQKADGKEKGWRMVKRQFAFIYDSNYPDPFLRNKQRLATEVTPIAGDEFKIMDRKSWEAKFNVKVEDLIHEWELTTND